MTSWLAWKAIEVSNNFYGHVLPCPLFVYLNPYAETDEIKKSDFYFHLAATQ